MAWPTQVRDPNKPMKQRLVFVLSRKAKVMLAGTTATTMKTMMALLMTQKCMSFLEVTGTNQSTLASTSIR